MIMAIKLSQNQMRIAKVNAEKEARGDEEGARFFMKLPPGELRNAFLEVRTRILGALASDGPSDGLSGSQRKAVLREAEKARRGEESAALFFKDLEKQNTEISRAMLRFKERDDARAAGKVVSETGASEESTPAHAAAETRRAAASQALASVPTVSIDQELVSAIEGLVAVGPQLGALLSGLAQRDPGAIQHMAGIFSDIFFPRSPEESAQDAAE
jgi:hypothetical protein